jgi:hypothetical protein
MKRHLAKPKHIFLCILFFGKVHWTQGYILQAKQALSTLCDLTDENNSSLVIATPNRLVTNTRYSIQKIISDGKKK